jgi:alanyl-tRNA synthetase
MSRLQAQLSEIVPGPSAMLAPEFAFMMYDTFGFPLDLTALLARAQGINVDINAAQTLLRSAQQTGDPANSDGGGVLGSATRCGSSSHSLTSLPDAGVLDDTETSFVGYDALSVSDCGVAQAGGFTLDGEGDTAVVRGWCVLDQSPFYAEAGGQVGDRGWLYLRPNGSIDDPDKLLKVDVINTTTVKRADNCNVGVLQVEIPVNRMAPFFSPDHDVVSLVREALQCNTDANQAHGGGSWNVAQAQVDSTWRHASAVHHTSTHLLHSALRQVLGDAVVQAGSLVSPDRLRFDFAYPRALTADQVR